MEHTVSQWTRGQKIGWSQASVCSSCGTSIESDDIGLPPDSERNLIISRDGAWRIAVADDEMIQALVALRRLTRTNPYAIQLPKTRKDLALWRGTLTEARWIQSYLAQSGIHSNTRPDRASVHDLSIMATITKTR